MRRTSSMLRPRPSVPDPAARTFFTQAASENAATMYRVPSRVAIETGVRRSSPLLRPRTERRDCDPIFRTRLSIATFSRTIQEGGGFALDMPREDTLPARRWLLSFL